MSNIRNLSRAESDPEEAHPPPTTTPPTLFMSETLVLDLGMNDYERGRLMKALTEFSTQRILALTAIGNFRFLHDALDTVHDRLSKAVTQWMHDVRPPGATETSEASSPRSKRRNLQDFHRGPQGHHDSTDRPERSVEGGISAHAAGVEGSVNRVNSKLAVIAERKIPGFMSLADFLERRFSKSVYSIGGVGRRYEMLRRRVAELSTLVETQLEMSQNEDQKLLLIRNKELLDKIDRLTLFGIVYYFGSVLAYILGPLLVLWGVASWVRFKGVQSSEASLEQTTDGVKVWIFLALIGIGIFLGRDVITTLKDEFKSSGEAWVHEIRAWVRSRPRALRTLIEGLSA